MNVRSAKSVHFIGVGGINMSAVAKLLLAAGVRVSGSDVAENDQTKILADRGAKITIGHSAENVPGDPELVVYTSAAPESNPEREEARRRGIPEMTNFQFLGEYFKDKKTIVVAGTHGKSTTTAMLGLILERSGLDPTVIIGSKVPSFPDGNLRIGHSDLFVVEGDEYAKHFLDFHPYGVIVNNIELDHTDVFPTIEAMKDAFRELIAKVKDDGIIVANLGDANVSELMAQRSMKPRFASFEYPLSMRLNVPGDFNRRNANAALIMARELGADARKSIEALESFTGIWRRFEFLCEKNGAKIYSDYGHHPTAVEATLRAAKERFPQNRIVLCFQPHHRNRTKHLFLDFVPSFDLADVLVLCEIYDVAGRDASEDENVSSKDLVDAIVAHDADREVKRPVEFAPNPTAAVEQTMKMVKEGDIVIFMGAGDIDGAARTLCN